MNDNYIEILLHRILCGKLYFYFKGEKYELRSSDNLIRYESDILYQNIINEEKYNEWIREENMLEVMQGLGLWHNGTESSIKQLNAKIDNLKVDLFKNFAVISKHSKLRQSLQSTRNQLNKILSAKQDFFNHTLEGYALSIKNEYIIYNTLYKKNKKVLNYNDSNSTSYTFFNDLISEINKYSVSIEDIKNVAKSDNWKSYWNANKNNIFPGSTTEWTDDQRGLVNLSKMYDSVYEHPECPNDNVINDDDMLDGWMIVQKRKNEKEKNQKTIEELNPKLKNAQEVFLMANDKADAQNILDLNSEESLYRLNQKMAVVNKLGSVEDAQLPDVKMDLMKQAAQMRKNK
jgi:hypothetical protein